MKTIAWIYDTPGWAYSNRAEALARQLPGYVHRFVNPYQQGFLSLLGADIIVCPDPRLLPYFGAGPKVVLNINAVKIFARTP